ncbi:MAG: zinc ABC transporter substrate-binding protein [Oscillospiraceae bacterium]|nr:zinc ABC transporter substrate-binding protein [Oscillospiraceae bacterium]
MKKYRAFIIITLCYAMLTGLCACDSGSGSSLSSDRLNIVCTNFPAYDFVRETAGERGNAILLVPPGAESHSFEPTPQDMAMLSECDLIVANGGVGEQWLSTMLSAGEIDAPVIYMLDCVEALEEEHKEGMQQAGHAHEHDEHCEHEHEHEHEHEAEFDEHVWTSPVNAAKISEAICTALCTIDPEGAEEYSANYAGYSAKLMELDGKFREVTEGAEHRLMIFADRFPVRYFTEEYGLEYYAAFPGCAEDTEPSAKTVAFLIDKVREEGIGAVYYIEFSNGKMADVIVEDTGCKKLLFHSCHNVGADELEAGVSYLSLMEKNLESLREGLG